MDSAKKVILLLAPLPAAADVQDSSYVQVAAKAATGLTDL